MVFVPRINLIDPSFASARWVALRGCSPATPRGAKSFRAHIVLVSGSVAYTRSSGDQPCALTQPALAVVLPRAESLAKTLAVRSTKVAREQHERINDALCRLVSFTCIQYIMHSFALLLYVSALLAKRMTVWCESLSFAYER